MHLRNGREPYKSVLILIQDRDMELAEERLINLVSCPNEP